MTRHISKTPCSQLDNKANRTLNNKSAPVLYNQLILLSRTLEAKLMNELIQQGFEGLNMSFAEPMMVITLGPIRMNQLAETLGISKQLCNQTLKPLEQLSIIERQSDPYDKRAKLVSLTKHGEKLAASAQAIISNREEQIIQLLETKDLSHIHKLLMAIANGADLHANPLVPTTGLISIVSRFCERQLMSLTANQGFDFLQMSYSQVLNYLTPKSVNPSRSKLSLSDLAQKNHVSLQAISRIARELEQYGIIEKYHSESDKRVKYLRLSPRGEELYFCSLNSVETLNQQCLNWLNSEQLQNLSCELSKINQQSKSILSSSNIIAEPDIKNKIEEQLKLLASSHTKAIERLNLPEKQQLLQLLNKLNSSN